MHKRKGFEYIKDIAKNAPVGVVAWNEGYEFTCGQAVNISDEDREKFFVDMAELKSLVESWELVKSHNGLEKTKLHRDYLVDFGSEFAGVSPKEIKRLNKAIADVESVGAVA